MKSDKDNKIKGYHKRPGRLAEERTAGLKKTNEQLKNEMAEHRQAEKEYDTTLLRQQNVNILQQSLLTPAPLEDKLTSITDSIVRLFDADFCRIWLNRPGDLCEHGCIHADVNKGPHICRYRDKCLHLLTSSGRYTHIDGKSHRRVPFGCYKIGRVASGEEHKFLTNDVQNDPRVHNHQWARKLGLVSFAGYQLRVPGGETLGVLALFAKHPILAAEDAMLDGLSNTVALVVQQALTEEVLRDSERMLEEAQEVAHLGNWSWNFQTNELTWSKENYRIFGIPPETPPSYETFEKIIHPDDKEFVNKFVEDALKGKKPHNIEFRIITSDGEERFVHAIAKMDYGDAEKPIRFFGIIQDITDRRRTEKEIENLAKFPSENPYPVLRISGDGTIMYSNKPGTTLLKKWEKSVGGKVDKKWRSLISQVLSSNIEKIIEVTCEYRVISFVITPIAEAGYVNLYGRDITVQQQVKKELQQTLKNLESQVKERTKILFRTVKTLQTEVEDRIAAERNADERARILDAFFGHTITPLVFLDRKFNFIRVNDAYASACQRNAPEFVGHNHFEFYPNEENQRIFENVVRTKLPYEVTAKPFSFPDHPEWGVTYWDWTLMPILDNAGEVEFLVFSLEDVTRRFKAETRTRITNVLLELFTKKTSRKEYLDSVVEAIRDCGGCRCVGIRIIDSQGYIPYESCVGFSQDFLELENMLCLNKDTCACIRIINKTAEPHDKTVMTPRGSFCCENSFEFIKKLTKKQQSRFRGNCVRYGFASIAVVPISYRDEMLGAIHLTDEQPNKISFETIQFIEEMSFLIGEAVHRFNVEADLRQSEDRYRSLVELAPDGIGVESDNRIVFVNTVGAKILGCDNPAEIIGRPVMDFVHPDYVKRAQRQLLYLQRKKRELTLNEIKLLRVDGAVFDAEMAAMPLVYQNKPAAQIVFHDITGRKQAEEKILADQRHLRSLTTELILTEERERRAIAAALHDSLGPLLAFSKRELGVLQKSAPAELTGPLNNIREFIKQAIEQTRELTFDLSPPTLYTFGLEHALEELIEHFSEENKLKCVFKDYAKIKSLPDDIKVLLYRSVHELLVNMVKHAGAKSAQVTLSMVEDNIQITVEDDGVGFDMADIDPQTGKSGGFGLFSIRQRLAQVGGRFDIQSRKGRGTKVVLLSPLKLKKIQKRRTKL